MPAKQTQDYSSDATLSVESTLSVDPSLYTQEQGNAAAQDQIVSPVGSPGLAYLSAAEDAFSGDQVQRTPEERLEDLYPDLLSELKMGATRLAGVYSSAGQTVHDGYAGALIELVESPVENLIQEIEAYARQAQDLGMQLQLGGGLARVGELSAAALQGATAALPVSGRYQFYPTHYQGTVLSGWKAPTPSGGDATAFLASWVEFLEKATAEFSPWLDEAWDVRAWADGLDYHENYRSKMVEKGYAALNNKLDDYHGRKREYMEAVAFEVMEPAWIPLFQSGVETGREIQLENDMRLDGVELTEDDYARLDDIVDHIIGALDDFSLGPREAKRHLESVHNPSEREYVLRRLRDEGVYADLYDAFEGDEHFEAGLASTDNYSMSAIHTGTEGASVVDSVVEAYQLLPGAVAAHSVGMAYSVPFAGDMLEASYGEDIKDGLNWVNTSLGADEASSQQSIAIATTGGKVTGTIAQAAVGGEGMSAWKAAAGEEGRMRAGFSALTSFEKATVTGQGADTTYNGYQAATGEKSSGQGLSQTERWAAGLGALSGGFGLANVADGARLAQTEQAVADGLTDPAMLTNARQLDAMDQTGAALTGMEGSGLKLADAYHKQEQSMHARTDAEVVADAEKLVRFAAPTLGGKISPPQEVLAMQQALDAGDMDTLRQLLPARQGNELGMAENSIGLLTALGD